MALIGGAATYQHHVLAVSRGHARAVPQNQAARPQALAAQEAALQKAVAARPGDAAARWALADFYLQTRQPARAAPQLNAMERLHSKDPGAQAALALGWLTCGRGDRAQPLYQGLIRHYPRSDAGWRGLAQSLFQQKRFYEAAQAATRATQIEPNSPQNHFLLGSAALEYARQFPNMAKQQDALQTSVSEFQKAAKAWPDNGEVFFQMGLAGAVQGNRSVAQAGFRRALALSPRPAIYAAMAAVYKTSSDPINARKMVEEGLTRFPNDAILHDLRGQLLQSSGEPGEAEQALGEYRKATALQPDNSTFQEHAGVAFFRANRLQEAQTAFETDIRLNPGHPFPYQQLAAIYTRQGEPQRAAAAAQTAAQCAAAAQSLQHLQELSKVHSGDVTLHLTLAGQYRKMGLMSAARDEYLLTLHLAPGNTQARQGLTAIQTLATADKNGGQP